MKVLRHFLCLVSTPIYKLGPNPRNELEKGGDKKTQVIFYQSQQQLEEEEAQETYGFNLRLGQTTCLHLHYLGDHHGRSFFHILASLE